MTHMLYLSPQLQRRFGHYKDLAQEPIPYDTYADEYLEMQRDREEAMDMLPVVGLFTLGVQQGQSKDKHDLVKETLKTEDTAELDDADLAARLLKRETQERRQPFWTPVPA